LVNQGHLADDLPFTEIDYDLARLLFALFQDNFNQTLGDYEELIPRSTLVGNNIPPPERPLFADRSYFV
jgi:hypothetical protein